MVGNDFLMGVFFMTLVWVTGHVIGAIRKRLRPKVSVVDEYSLSLGESKEFPTILLTLKLDNGRSEGPYEFVPAFAHSLSDELCVSAARSVKSVTNLRSTVPKIDIEGNESA